MRKVLILLSATALPLLVGQVLGAGTTFKAVVKNDSVVTTSSYFTINLYCANHDSVFQPPYPNRQTWVSPFAFNGNISVDWTDGALTNGYNYGSAAGDTVVIKKYMDAGFYNYWDAARFLLVESWADGLPDRFSFVGIANNNGFPPQVDSVLTLRWHAKTANDSGYFCIQKGDMDNGNYDWLFDDPQPDFAMQCWSIEADTFKVFDFSVPVFDTIFDTIRVAEGATLTIPGTVLYEVGGNIAGQGSAVIHATDPGKTITLSYSPTLVRATFTDNGDGSGGFVYEPDFTDAGYYTVNFVASNGVFADTETAVIHVMQVNALPVITNMGNKTVNEYDSLKIDLSATDADGDELTFGYNPLLLNAFIVRVSSTSAIFEFYPDESQGGTIDSIWFTVHDGANPWGWDSDRVIITVVEVNDPPILAPIGAKTVKAGSLLKFNISATDPEGGAITLATSTLPTGATFADSLNGKGTFNWTPTAEQIGIDTVAFYASDGNMTDTEVVTIDVYCCDLPGDASDNGKINMLDITYLLRYLYKGGPPSPCRAEGDVNGDGVTNMTDVVYLIDYLYKYGSAPKCGSEVSIVTDIDGNIYHTIKIGNQWWMVENLKVTHYSNGEAIPNVTDDATWQGLATGAYCEYNNDLNNVATYGRLYNWYSITDSRNIAPAGWHIPSDTEWQTLADYLGGSPIAGGKMKEAGTTHWNSPNTGATNESGFSALPGGCRSYYGYYHNMGYFALF